MTIRRLDEKQIEMFAKLPEVAMSTQIATDENGQPTVIASGRLAIQFDELLQHDLSVYREFFLIDGINGTEEYGARMEAWTRNLQVAENLNPAPPDEAFAMLAFIHLGPRFPLPGVPYRPSYTHGHLPFHGTCGGAEKYYRYEQFPTSKRIDLRKNAVVQKDTYGAPASEVPFTPTGLSAVGRFALPLLFPACWRYELTPPPKTKLFYGASVPLYGQSGGAVEIMFPDPFNNVAPIPPALILPIL